MVGKIVSVPREKIGERLGQLSNEQILEINKRWRCGLDWYDGESVILFLFQVDYRHSWTRYTHWVLQPYPLLQGSTQYMTR